MKYLKLFFICIIAVLAISIFYTDFYLPNKGYRSIKDIGDWIVLKDSMNIDSYWRFKDSVYGADEMDVYNYHDLCFLEPLKVDAKNIEVCKGSGYARDKEHVYYPYRKIFVDYDYYPDGLLFHGPFFDKYLIKNAHPSTFKYIGNGYGVDGRRMFYNGEEISWDDDVISRQLEKQRISSTQ